MNDIATAILDAAERRMRIGGFGGFSHREIAAEVGVKSSSVHYHFPTKDKLAAAVIRRYADHVSELITREFATEADPVKAWTRAFRAAVYPGERICPCTVLSAEASDLPPEVGAEVKRFYTMCMSTLTATGMSDRAAIELLSTLTGAMVVANGLNDGTVFDRAMCELLGETPAQPAA
ncbi:TetR/AcrR family transcriptional regulator [Nitrospirillum sp. BR 11163]|uniref:TetR/AcrR family transcriptional regulator n=1 Tax=Nitrospirillum sp. BR 11163 TaxID=3104323 RepID=UPI002AFE7E56|nr:TetR/AcrR family transcriptional regulator [Nitrospirillum sp. BR 11163]MEA1672833.1 TetR/AcrR family transcriptional regulator [Nitrospirillum sp. BR 11163]